MCLCESNRSFNHHAGIHGHRAWMTEIRRSCGDIKARRLIARAAATWTAMPEPRLRPTTLTRSAGMPR
jgi:hypothetical protein